MKASPALGLLACWLTFAATTEAATYIAPLEGRHDVRRDQLQIDADTMDQLSRHLVVLAQETAGRNGDKPEGLRTTAQLLALAGFLSPGNKDVNKLSDELLMGMLPELPPQDQMERALKRGWQVRGWLNSGDAGKASNTFAKLLGDPLRLLDPQAPEAENAAVAERAWNGWIASFSSFEKIKEPEPAVADEDPADHEEPPPAVADRLKLALRDVKVRTPLYVSSGGEDESKVALVTMQLRARQDNGDSTRYDLSVDMREPRDRDNQAMRRLPDLVTKRHKEVPRDCHAEVRLDGRREYDAFRNHTALTGPAAVAMEATLSGKAPAGDLIVLASVEDDGRLTMPKRGWDLLRALRENSAGGRLVVPKDCEDMLRAILVFEDPGFFFKYEVWYASNLQELLERSAPTLSGSQEEARQKFAEIRKVAEGKPVGAFVANRFVRERLAEVRKLAPDLASAGMLEIQGSGTRPTKLAAPVFARELLVHLRPLAKFATDNEWNIDANEYDRLHESLRKPLDALAPYLESNERTLLTSAVDCVNRLRTIARTVRQNRDGADQDQIREGLAGLKRDLEAVYKQIQTVSGEPVPKLD